MNMTLKKNIGLLFSACLIFIAAFAFLSCGFDETKLQDVPDEILYPDLYGDNKNKEDINSTGEVIPEKCEREEPELEEFGDSEGLLTGAWARKMTLASVSDARQNGDYEDSSNTYWELVQINHQGKRVREVVELCKAAMVPVSGAELDFSKKMISTLPVLAHEGDFVSVENNAELQGAAYANEEPFIRLWGLTKEATNKEWERCDFYFNDDNIEEECPIALWPEIYDMDCDAKKGATVKVTLGTIGPEEIYLIRRTTINRKGVIKSLDLIEGSLTFEDLLSVVGVSMEMFKSQFIFVPVKEDSKFKMVRIPEGSTCETVLEEFGVNE